VRSQRDVFGEVADAYESARSGYPDELISDVLRYASPVHRVLEVGAGTGKATAAFAARGLSLLCLEPDARMASVLRRTCAAFRSVDVEVTGFETWRPTERFRLLVAAQSWHWVNRDSRWNLAYAALQSGGTIALFWNYYAVADPDLQRELYDLDLEHGVVHSVHTPHEHSADFYADEIEQTDGWPSLELADDERFTDFQSRRYRRTRTLDTDTYIDLLSSISAYRMLADAERGEFLDTVRETVQSRGGSITLGISTDLFLGRRR
jgi:SAM-dependent methyltransferase